MVVGKDDVHEMRTLVPSQNGSGATSGEGLNSYTYSSMLGLNKLVVILESFDALSLSRTKEIVDSYIRSIAT
jgi:hypothetical protein